MTPWLLSWETKRKMKPEKLSNCSSLCVLIAYLTIWNLSGSPVALRNSLHSLSNVQGQTPQFKLCYQTQPNQLMLSREGDPWQFKEQFWYIVSLWPSYIVSLPNGGTSQIKLEIGHVGLWRKGNTKLPEENLSKQRKGPTKMSTHSGLKPEPN